MARNRKNQSAAVRFGPALKAFLLCVFVGGSGIGYVGQKKQIHELGRQIATRELRLKNLREQNKGRQSQVNYLQSQPALETRLRDLNLGLGLPHPSQVVLLQLPIPVKSEEDKRFTSAELRKEFRSAVR